jgi:hypothetical protein
MSNTIDLPDGDSTAAERLANAGSGVSAPHPDSETALEHGTEPEPDLSYPPAEPHGGAHDEAAEQSGNHTAAD